MFLCGRKVGAANGDVAAWCSAPGAAERANSVKNNMKQRRTRNCDEQGRQGTLEVDWSLGAAVGMGLRRVGVLACACWHML